MFNEMLEVVMFHPVLLKYFVVGKYRSYFAQKQSDSKNVKIIAELELDEIVDPRAVATVKILFRDGNRVCVTLETKEGSKYVPPGIENNVAIELKSKEAVDVKVGSNNFMWFE